VKVKVKAQKKGGETEKMREQQSNHRQLRVSKQGNKTQETGAGG